MGAITGPELLRADAKKVFIELNAVVEKSIITIDKLTRATIRLHQVKGTDREARALTKVNKLATEQLGLKEKAIMLDKKHTATQRQLEVALKKTGVATKKTTGAFASMALVLKTLLGPMAILFALWQGIKNLKDTVVRLDSFKFALEKITDTSARTVESMRYLITVANDFGVSLNVAADRYVKFFTAAKQSGLAVEETRKIFSNMSKAAGVLGLKAHEVEGVFLALEQMLSKGKVTTEELRRQLGERLPGAFGVMAQAVGVSVNELDALLKKGQVLSAEMLPKFAEEYNKAFGIDKVERVETLQASISRFGTSWTAMIFEIENGTSAFSKVFIGFFDGMAFGINTLSANLVIMGDETLSAYQKLRLLGLSGPAKIQIAGQLGENADAERARDELVFLMKGLNEIGDLKKLINEEDLRQFNQAGHWGETQEEEIERLKDVLGINEMTTAVAIKRMEQLKARQKLNEAEFITAKRTVDYLDKLIKKEKADLASKFETANLSEKELQNKIANLKLLEDERKILAIRLGLIDETGKKIKEIKEIESIPLPPLINIQTDLLRQLKELQKEVKGLTIYENERRLVLKDTIALLEKMLILERSVTTTKSPEALGAPGGDYRKQLDDQEGIGLFDPEKLVAEFLLTEEYIEKGWSAFAAFLDEKTELQQKYIDTSIALANQLFELGDALFERQLENIQAEMNAVEDKYDRMYDLAEGDKRHQKEIAKQKEFEMKKLEKEELKIKQKQAKFDKAHAIFNIIISTVSGVMKASPAIPLMAIIAALGAASIATVIAQPIPQYAEGRGDGKDEYAIVGDGGRSEIISGKRGVRKTPSKSTLTHLDKTDSVYPSERAYKDMIMRSIIHEVNTNFESKQIEEAIEKGFKKAQNNIYVKMPKINIANDMWAFQNSQFN